jgi:hypothetical protein
VLAEAPEFGTNQGLLRLLGSARGYEFGRLPWLALLYLRSRFLRPRLAMDNLRLVKCGAAKRPPGYPTVSHAPRRTASVARAPLFRAVLWFDIHEPERPPVSMRQWPKQVG